jgi:hypothetical protein
MTNQLVNNSSRVQSCQGSLSGGARLKGVRLSAPPMSTSAIPGGHQGANWSASFGRSFPDGALDLASDLPQDAQTLTLSCHWFRHHGENEK